MTCSGKKIYVNGLTFNVIVEGEGKDIVLLHGFPDSSDIWRYQIPALVKAGYRVIVPDLRGSGGTDAPRGVSAYRMEHLISDVIGIMDQLGVKRAPLVGHDWGALLGWYLVCAHPGRFERYVALSVGHPASYLRGGVEQKLKGWYTLFFQLPWLPELVARSCNWFGTRLFTGFNPEMERWVRDKGRPGRLTAGINWYRANLMRAFFGEKPPKAKVPVFGIWSSRDLYLSERQMINSERYVDAPWRYHRIDGVDHWMTVAAPDRVNALLLDYLNTEEL